MQSPIFCEKYCERFGVEAGNYDRALLRHTLFPHARCVLGVIERVAPTFFAADRALVAEVGRATERRDFYFAIDEFREHPANRRFLRRVLGLRISATRCENVFYAIWNSPANIPSRPAPGSI
jgi:hypothetical protein